LDSNNSVHDISINDELRDLGVTKIVKQRDLVQIIIDRQKVVSFNIHPKEFQQTMDRFRKSAVNGTTGLSKEIVNKMELILVYPDNGYVSYLQLGNGKNRRKYILGLELNLNLVTTYMQYMPLCTTGTINCMKPS